jgi:hypothetical protein
MTTSTLGFTVRLAVTPADLRRACEVRVQSYGHHMPAWRDSLAQPDAIDTAASTAVLLCEDKHSGDPVGTIRIQSSREGPLLIERSVELPDAMTRQCHAEVTRLCTVKGADLLVKIALWKAAYLHCHASQARWVVVGARNEALARQYRRLGFSDLHADRRMVPLEHAGGLPHHILAVDVYAVERHARQANHGLYGFFFDTDHPDIQWLAAPRMPQRSQELAAA